MSLLHDYLTARNLRAFQLALYARGMPGSQKSYSVDVNVRDWLGRTPLHLACTSLEYIEFLRALLKHPHIDINLPDLENLWTPLHRALYSANISAAVLLIQSPAIDTSLKDLEGYTAFDLYNSTLNGTKPGFGDARLYTWGANRNAALGLGDGNDRSYPELVSIESKDDPARTDISSRFSPVYVQQIQMSRLHTAVITSENEGNMRLCGFGSGGRLGFTQHTQFVLKPLLSFHFPILSVAVGQDHTLALTKSGEVYSWGLNRFSQLGYVVEVSNTASSRLEEPIQHLPKKVVGLLKKEVVLGVAASKNASACWTKDAVFTWGTNVGQLGYDKSVQPVQLLPRAVTKFKHPVIGLALGETVLAALLLSRQVECIWNDRHIRVLFPMHPFPIGIQPYRPPQCVKDAHIVKITCCDDNFAGLSSNGEVFIFSPNQPAASETLMESRVPGPIFKPHKIWSLRKKFCAVKDVALGSDSTMIVCTESGHVYIRSRNTTSSSNKTYKWNRVPFLQRVSQVCANSTGSFAALRIDHRPCPILPTGNTIAKDMKALEPYFHFYRPHAPPKRARGQTIVDVDEPDEVEVGNDIEGALELFQILSGEQYLRTVSHGRLNCDGIRLPYDADVLVYLQSGQIFPVHRIILAARSRVMERLFSASILLDDSMTKISFRLLPAKLGPGFGVRKLTCLKIEGCHPITVLILLRYLYSDELIAIWDRRVSIAVQKELESRRVDPAQVNLELRGLARILDLSALSLALEHPVKYDPQPTMVDDMQRLFDVMQPPFLAGSPLSPNVVIRLADNDVYTHSILLRSRTPLFASFFDLEDWTKKRWDADGMISINMTHLHWHVMRFVFGFMCCGSGREMFESLEFVESVEDFVCFMFDVAAAANELLLERLVLICASVILEHCKMQNACYILENATYYHIVPLIERLQEYIAINMEVFLQSQMFDEIPDILIKQLSRFVNAQQLDKSPFSRSDFFVNQLLTKHAEWLAEQDIPGNIVRKVSKEPSRTAGIGNKVNKASPDISVKTIPKIPTKPKTALGQSSANALRHPPSGGGIFLMDELDSPAHPAYKDRAALPTTPVQTYMWKPMPAPRVNMKKIMAETVQAATKVQPSLLPSSSTSQSSKNFLTETMPRSFGESPVQRPVALPRGSGLGPVITPKRSSQFNTNSANIRRDGSKAWSHPSGQPTAKSAPATGMTFVAIQDSQKQDQPVKDVRSFREIQEEEQSLQLEADFLKWWTAEEERVRLEALALTENENALNKQADHSQEKGRRKGKRTEARRRFNTSRDPSQLSPLDP